MSSLALTLEKRCPIDVKKLECSDFLVIDMDTGKQLDRCQWANDNTGEIGYFAKDEKGKTLTDNLITEKRNIKLVYRPLEEK